MAKPAARWVREVATSSAPVAIEDWLAATAFFALVV